MKTEFHSKHAKHYIALIILLIATTASGFILFNDAYDESPPPKDVTTVENEEYREQNVYNTVDKKEHIPSDTNEKKTESIEQPIQNEPSDTDPPKNQMKTLPETFSEVSEEEEEILIDATFIAPGISYKARLAANSNVYDLMNILRDIGIIFFTTKDFGGNLGLFIEQINGIKNGTDNKFWIYYINEKEAKTGISNYTLNNNDVIEWKYEESTF